VRKQHDRRRGRAAAQVIVEPGELFGPERSEAVFLQIDDIDERNKMHAVVVESIPAAARRAFAETLEIGLLSGRIDDVVLAGRVVHIEPGCSNKLMSVVEFLRLGQMGDVARVQHEGGLCLHSLDFVDRLFESRPRVGIGGLGESDVAVGNLDKGKAALLGLGFADQARRRHAAGKRPDDARSRPHHAFQHLPSVQPRSRRVHASSPRRRTRRSLSRLGQREVYSPRPKLFSATDADEARRAIRAIIDFGLDAFKARPDNATMVDKYAVRSGDCRPKFSSTSAPEVAKAKSKHQSK
jgi:hypothetical protein